MIIEKENLKLWVCTLPPNMQRVKMQFVGKGIKIRGCNFPIYMERDNLAKNTEVKQGKTP
jgi:hypothetical protein